MKYWLKSALGLLLSVLVIAITAIIMVIATFNPNHYKTEISQWVHTHTGRNLEIAGDIQLTLSPLMLDMKQVKMSNPEGFKTAEFLEVAQLKMNLLWQPLLEHVLIVSNLELNGVQLSLTRQSDGKVNWNNNAPSAKKSEVPSIPQQSLIKSIQIQKVSINNSQLNFDDEISKHHYNLIDLNFSSQLTADLEKHQFQLEATKFTATVENKQHKQPIVLNIPQLQFDTPLQQLNWNTELQFGAAQLHAQLQVTQLLSNPTYQAKLQLTEFDATELLTLFELTDNRLPKRLAFTAELQGSLTADHFIKNLSAKADDYQLHLAEIKFNLGDQLLETNNLKLIALGQEIITQIKATGLLSRPQVSAQTQAFGTQLQTQLSLERQPKLALRGTLKLGKLDLRATAALLKWALPETQDKTVFNHVTFETELEISPSQLNLTQFNINFDDSILKGNLKLQNFLQPTFSFRLNLDNIDVDRYSSLKTADKSKNSSLPIPMDVLKKLNVNGILTVTNFKMAKMNVKEMNLKVVTKAGKVKVSTQ